jgi:transposase
MLQSVLRRSWSPRGKTPIHVQSQSHQRISVISAITLSPQRKRLNAHFRLHTHNIKSADVLAFLEGLRRIIRGKIILIMDNWNVHKAKSIQRFLAQHRNTIIVKWLPTYAPQLNPVEQLWSHSKYSDLNNTAPSDVQELESLVDDSLNRTRTQQRLLRSFFVKPKLVI